MNILEMFRNRNPELNIEIIEDVDFLYGYDKRNRKSETGQRWRCNLVVDNHKVALLYTKAELESVRAESNSGRGIYEGLLVHANRTLTQYGIQLR